MNLVESLNSIQSQRCCRCGWQASGLIMINNAMRYLCKVHFEVEMGEHSIPNWRLNPYASPNDRLTEPIESLEEGNPS